MKFAHIQTQDGITKVTEIKAASSPYGNCCENQAIQGFDYEANGIKYINRLCLKCKTHWHGPKDGVTQYTSAKWDALINKVEVSQ